MKLFHSLIFLFVVRTRSASISRGATAWGWQSTTACTELPSFPGTQTCYKSRIYISTYISKICAEPYVYTQKIKIYRVQIWEIGQTWLKLICRVLVSFSYSRTMTSDVKVLAHLSDLWHQYPLWLLLHIPAPHQGPQGRPPGLPRPDDGQLRPGPDWLVKPLYLQLQAL